LPSAGVVIFDEAHQLAETAAQFLGAQLGTGQLLDLGQDLRAAGLRWARGLADWQALHDGLRHAVRTLRLLAAGGGGDPGDHGAARVPWAGPAPDGVDPAQWADALEHEGHADWYLPAQAELTMAWANVPELFSKGWHWSSSQFSASYAWLQLFNDGDQTSSAKGNELRARAVRRLIIQ